MDEAKRRQIEGQNAAILATPCLVRLAWSVDPKWADTSGRKRKKWINDAGGPARYQISQPLSGRKLAGGAKPASLPAANTVAKKARAKASEKAKPRKARAEKKRSEKPGASPSPAVATVVSKIGELSDADRQAAMGALSEATTALGDQQHPMNRLRDNRTQAAFGDGGPEIVSVMSTPEAMLSADDHEAMAKTHALIGTAKRLLGEPDIARANYDAAKYHGDMAKRKRPQGVVAPKPEAPKSAPASPAPQQNVRPVPLSQRPEHSPRQGPAKLSQPAQQLHAHLTGAGMRVSSKATAKNVEGHKQALAQAIQHMPEEAVSRIGKVLKSVTVHGSHEEFGESYQRYRESFGGDVDPEQVARMASGHVKGLFTHNSKTGGGMLIDGEHEVFDDIHGKGRVNAHETYAHELTHAIDYADPKNPLSEQEGWKNAFGAEIKRRPDAQTGKIGAVDRKGRLSHYATTDPQEGFAEFGRLIYGTSVDLALVEKHFPRASAYFKEKKLWPTR